MGTIYILPYNQWNEHVFGADTIETQRPKKPKKQRQSPSRKVYKLFLSDKYCYRKREEIKIYPGE